MSEIKSMDEKGIEFLGNEEGLRLSVYRDIVGIATIGYGNTYYADGTKVKMTDPPITKEQAIELFKTILKHYETAVWSVTRDDINQNQFNALCSLAYNIGVGGFKSYTGVKRVNANPNDPRITEAFKMWRKPAVLLARRKREAALYFS
jgi:lysozyme